MQFEEGERSLLERNLQFKATKQRAKWDPQTWVIKPQGLL
jgi:hypothetical protein